MHNRYPLAALQQLLAPDTKTTGVVFRVTDGTADIATARGLARCSSPTSLRVGQRVTVENGRATPAAVAAVRYSI